MLIDTGMAATGIGEVCLTVFNELLDENRITVIGTSGRTAAVSGERVVRKAQLDSLKIGSFEHKQIGIREGELNALGIDYLSRYVITLDFPKNILYLEMGKRFSESSAFDMSGLVVVRIGGETVVVKVFPDGPARTAGLRADDPILKVNGKNAEDYSLFELRHLLAKDGQEVRLTVRRGRLVKEYEILLTNWQNIVSSKG